VFRRFLGLPAPDEPNRQAAPDAGGRPREGATAPIGETATVRRIVARLEALPHDQARYLAGFAYVMSRAAEADLDISAEETAVMEHFVVELGGIDEAQAVLVVEMAKLQARMQGATEDFLVTREFARIATEDQRLAVLRCCFAVSAADNSISATEASVVNEIARELDLTREQLNEVRSDFVEQLSAIQAMHRLNQPG